MVLISLKGHQVVIPEEDAPLPFWSSSKKLDLLIIIIQV